MLITHNTTMTTRGNVIMKRFHGSHVSDHRDLNGIQGNGIDKRS